MTDTSLIERVKKAQAEMRAENQAGWPNLIDEVIAALTTPTSDEVAEMALHLKSHHPEVRQQLHKAADLLQRLDRERQTCDALADEVLEKENNLDGHKTRIRGLKRQLDLVTRQRNPLDLDEFAHQVATEFYYWWHNQPGANTQQGFREFWKLNRRRFSPPHRITRQEIDDGRN